MPQDTGNCSLGAGGFPNEEEILDPIWEKDLAAEDTVHIRSSFASEGTVPGGRVSPGPSDMDNAKQKGPPP
jgi:hypothetical protein